MANVLASCIEFSITLVNSEYILVMCRLDSLACTKAPVDVIGRLSQSLLNNAMENTPGPALPRYS